MLPAFSDPVFIFFKFFCFCKNFFFFSPAPFFPEYLPAPTRADSPAAPPAGPRPRRLQPLPQPFTSPQQRLLQRAPPQATASSRADQGGKPHSPQHHLCATHNLKEAKALIDHHRDEKAFLKIARELMEQTISAAGNKHTGKHLAQYCPPQAGLSVQESTSATRQPSTGGREEAQGWDLPGSGGFMQDVRAPQGPAAVGAASARVGAGKYSRENCRRHAGAGER